MSGYLALSSSVCGPSPTSTLVPGRSSLRKLSRFFSTAMRPTFSQIGRFSSLNTSGRPGRNSSVSTPRVHWEMLRKPCRSSSSRMEAVATITRPDGLWNHFM